MAGRIARVAQLVEHDLAKVGVAGSSPVSRSEDASERRHRYFGPTASVATLPGWWNGRHEGLKIPWSARAVWVQVPPRAPER